MTEPTVRPHRTPADFYPKANWADGPDDLYAQGMVVTHCDVARLPSSWEKIKPKIIKATAHLLVGTELLYEIAQVGFSERYSAALGGAYVPFARMVMAPWEGWTSLAAPQSVVDANPTGFDDWEHLKADGAFTNWLLRIEGANRTLVYKLRTYRPRTDSYEAAWAD